MTEAASPVSFKIFDFETLTISRGIKRPADIRLGVVFGVLGVLGLLLDFGVLGEFLFGVVCDFLGESGNELLPSNCGMKSSLSWLKSLLNSNKKSFPVLLTFL